MTKAMQKEICTIPASFAQERFWPTAPAESGSPAFHIAGAVRFRPTPDIEVLRRSLNEVVRRQESLRTKFRVADGRLFQVVVAPDVVPIEEMTAPDSDEETGRLLSAIAGRPFDLKNGPLLRVVLLTKVGAEECTLLLVVHCTVAD